MYSFCVNLILHLSWVNAQKFNHCVMIVNGMMFLISGVHVFIPVYINAINFYILILYNVFLGSRFFFFFFQ